MQAERNLKCWYKLPLIENTAHMKGQRAIAEFFSFDPAKHDGSSGKDRVPVIQQKLKRRSEGGKCYVDLLVRIFRAKIVF